MQFYHAITIISLILMAAGVIAVAVNLIIKNRADRISYIRSFKAGKSFVIYLFAIPLYSIGSVYAGENAISAILSSFQGMGDLLVLKYNVAPIQALMADCTIYRITVYICFVLVFFNAIVFFLSLAMQYLWSGFRNLHFSCSTKEKLILFGNNEQNHLIYKSDDRRTKAVVDKVKGEDVIDLYVKNIAYTSVSVVESYVEKTVQKSAKRKRAIVAIVNTGDDERNIQICRSFIKNISSLDEGQRSECFVKLKVFVFGDSRYETIYSELSADSCGCISYLNKYQKIASDWVDKYPVSRFLTDEQIDYQTSLVKEGVELNAFLVGFGKTNQQIFLTSVANNQFITQTEKGIGVKKIKYHIFDKNPAECNKNLNHNYYRYKNECEGFKQEDYLPLPDYPAEENFQQLDLNSTKFYQEIHKAVCLSKKGVNLFVIAFGSDLENVDMAHKLAAKCREWGVQNFYLFVKIRGGEVALDEPNCIAIANEEEVVYDVEKILGDDIFRMAQMRNAVYDIEYELTQDGAAVTDARVAQIKATAYQEWFTKKTQMQRESSLYGCLSIRSKLNMMGLDYRAVTAQGEALSEQEYLETYARGDKPDIAFYSVQADGKPIVHYSLEFKPSRRTSLAIHEHLRWNAFMISKGMVPASKKQILEEKDERGKYTNGKNFAVRRHGNLTTFEGLVEFRKMIAERDREKYDSLDAAEESSDVIKYDYQLLDEAYWLLTENGYKIVRL